MRHFPMLMLWWALNYLPCGVVRVTAFVTDRFLLRYEITNVNSSRSSIIVYSNSQWPSYSYDHGNDNTVMRSWTWTGSLKTEFTNVGDTVRTWRQSGHLCCLHSSVLHKLQNDLPIAPACRSAACCRYFSPFGVIKSYCP